MMPEPHQRSMDDRIDYANTHRPASGVHQDSLFERRPSRWSDCTNTELWDLAAQIATGATQPEPRQDSD